MSKIKQVVSMKEYEEIKSRIVFHRDVNAKVRERIFAMAAAGARFFYRRKKLVPTINDYCGKRTPLMMPNQLFEVVAHYQEFPTAP